MALSPGHAPPAALGNVDADAVGTVLRDLRLAGALASARRAAPACSVEGHQPGGPRLLHPVGACEHGVHEEAAMVHTAASCPVRFHV